jgi:hypothetical protein
MGDSPDNFSFNLQAAKHAALSGLLHNYLQAKYLIGE